MNNILIKSLQIIILIGGMYMVSSNEAPDITGILALIGILAICYHVPKLFKFDK
jgi:hypothetical protein